MTKGSSAVAGILENLKTEDSPMITIHCNDGDIMVKKILLTAVSEIFRAMFSSDMLEKRTNTVAVVNVDLITMKFIIGYYENGKISDTEIIDKNAFTYVVDKYNFLGIKEAMAERVFNEYNTKKEIELLGEIFTTYHSPVFKVLAINELVAVIVKGKKSPDFIMDFDAQDFFELSKSCCNFLREMKFEEWKAFLDCFSSWLSKNTEERSGAATEILSIIDIRRFSVIDAQKMVQSLPLSRKFQGFQLMFGKILDSFVVHNLSDHLEKTFQCSSGALACSVCQHPGSHPFHYSDTCKGVHRCHYWSQGSYYTHNGGCGQTLVKECQLFSSLSYD